MKQQATPAVIVTAIIVAVLVLGFIGWRAFGSHSGAAADTETINTRIAGKKAHGAD